ENRSIILITFTDITKSKAIERNRELTANILDTLNRTNNLNVIINDILNLIKNYDNYDAVGIRYKEGEDYPYLLTDGLSESFLNSEKYLCSRTEIGEIKYDENGKPIFECMCGNIVCGKFDPSFSFYTQGGSFWSNNISDYFSNPQHKVINSITRTNCLDNGYESVALIPLKFDNEIAGLLQINDKKKNKFTPDLIEFFEGISSSIGISIRRRKTRDELRLSEAKFRSYIENAPDGIFIVNKEGKYIDANKAACDMTQYSYDEIMTMNIADLLTPEGLNDGIKSFMDLQKNNYANAELLCKKKDGTHFYMLLDAVKLDDNTFLGYCKDISERKKTENELIESKERAEELNRLKSSFLANMSHELRTPMVGILGFSQYLLEIDDLEEIKEVSGLLNSSGKRLMETLNLILDLSRIESGETKLYLEEIDLIEEILETINTYKTVAIQKGLELNFESKLEFTNILSDRRVLQSILNNLINNAIKYTLKGEVKVIVGKEFIGDDEYVVIDVADTGLGIPEDYIDSIFEEFRQVSEGIGRSFEGTGLGLTLSKKFVTLLDGAISVKSKLNEGSTFTVKLPMKTKLDKSDKKIIKELESSAIPQQLEKPASKLSDVLLVEDDNTSIAFVQKMIGNLYNLEVVKNAIDAIEKTKRNKYSVILMDINLGSGMNGLDAVKEIRKLASYKETPIVALTAFAMTGDREEFITGGCTHYLSKPFGKQELIGLLNEIVV
ncbi:MAG: ATP-binding protein, partial [FCB group bacterium]